MQVVRYLNVNILKDQVVKKWNKSGFPCGIVLIIFIAIHSGINVESEC